MYCPSLLSELVPVVQDSLVAVIISLHWLLLDNSMQTHCNSLKCLMHHNNQASCLANRVFKLLHSLCCC